MHIQPLGGRCRPNFNHSRKIENVSQYKQILCKSQDRFCRNSAESQGAIVRAKNFSCTSAENFLSLAKGLIERIGSEALIALQANGSSAVKQAAPLRDHRAALDYVVRWIISAESRIGGIQSLNDIHAVGHRVVHGAEKFTMSVVITGEVIEGIEDCIDTSMGMTPLEGLVMGTRCGDLDPSVLEYLSHKEGTSFGEIDTLLNKQSGLLGIY
jgi:acetate kinase